MKAKKRLTATETPIGDIPNSETITWGALFSYIAQIG